jgi:hypothetical protein
MHSIRPQHNAVMGDACTCWDQKQHVWAGMRLDSDHCLEVLHCLGMYVVQYEGCMHSASVLFMS